jgi:hypothetical protein
MIIGSYFWSRLEHMYAIRTTCGKRDRQIFDSIQRSEFQVAFTAKEEFELFLFACKGFQPPWLASGARAATLMPVLAYFQQLNKCKFTL